VGRVKWALSTIVGLYLIAALIGRLLEAAGVARCGCSAGCWCRKPGLSTFRWVLPFWHR
jgi:hypothetical protein